MSNYKTVFFTLGVLQIILGVSMIIPIIFQIIFNELDSSFIGAGIITVVFGVFSKSEIIVDPVVVIPDILSKKASVIERSIVENINGNDPKIAILNHDKAVNKNACCKFNFFS